MRVWQPRDWLVYPRAGVYLTCTSLYCTFTPISPTAATAQWAIGAPAFWHRSCVRIPWWYYNFLLPAGLRVAQPCRYCFYSEVQKWGFRPAAATRCPDIGAEMWEYSPQNCKKISILVRNLYFTKFSAFVRVYRYLLSF